MLCIFILIFIAEHFKELLTQSKREFHEMFKRTYGAIYEQNSNVFSDLFNELEGYYTRGKVDLVEAMDSFFNTLYQKMFTVINMQYNFDDRLVFLLLKTPYWLTMFIGCKNATVSVLVRYLVTLLRWRPLQSLLTRKKFAFFFRYLGCVSEHMKELKPFGDVPDKLSVQIKRSFVATRTFAQALNTAADVTKSVQNVSLCRRLAIILNGDECIFNRRKKPCRF